MLKVNEHHNHGRMVPVQKNSFIKIKSLMKKSGAINEN